LRDLPRVPYTGTKNTMATIIKLLKLMLRAIAQTNVKVFGNGLNNLGI
jgi:hypothetical protein